MVKHEERYRRLWMQPRPKRSIPPYIMQHVLFLFIGALDGEGKLHKNNQKVLSNQLEDHGLKNDFGSRDINPGGIRTYVAQLESLGLIFHDKHQRYRLTLAGEDLLKPGDITSLMQTQLIRYQYPSAYSKAKKVGIHPEIKVRPSSFLLKLCRDVGLDGLSSDELAIPVVYGHTEKAFNLCKEKILESRSLGGISDLLNAEKDIDLFYSPRRKPEYKDRVKSIQYIKDIGATMRAHLLSNRLIFREVGSDRFKVEETALPLIDSVNKA